MDFRINKQTSAGIVTNETRVQDEIARVILLAEKDGLNSKNEKERGKSNQHERNQYETLSAQGALKTKLKISREERIYKAQSCSINTCHQHLVSCWA